MAASAPAPRVLFIMGTLDPRTGGPSGSAPNIWVSALRAGLAVAVAVPAAGSEHADETRTLDRLRAEGAEVFAFAAPRPRRLRHWGVSLPFALWVLRAARRYDIVQAHGAWTFPALVGLLAAHLAGTRFVLTPHESLTDSDVAKGRLRTKHWLKRLVRGLYLEHAAAIVFASETERRASVGSRARARARCEVIYHPVVDDPASLPPPRRFPARIEELRVGFLGRFDPKKNLELLIEAVAGAPRTRLEIAGGGEAAYERRLRDLAEASGAAARTRWRGFIPAGERPGFFAAIDVLAMPSAFEGFGMVAAEAMCHGVPAIVAEATGIGELVRRHDCGIVAPASVAGLRAAFESLIADPGRLGRFSERAIEAAGRELTFARYGASLAALYRSLVNRPPAGAPSGSSAPRS